MPLPTCECVKGLPIGEQLAAIYCATYTLAAGDVDGPYLLKSANLSDVADAAASRANIGAAASGANTDITSLGGVLNIGVGGATPTAATYPKVIAYPSAGTPQSITENDYTIVDFGSEIQDTAGIWATNSATIPTNAAGTYQVNIAGLYLGSGATGTGDAILTAFVNGSVVAHITKTFESLTSGKAYILNGSVQLVLAAGDVLTIRIFHGNGAGWEIINNGLPYTDVFSLHRVF